MKSTLLRLNVSTDYGKMTDFDRVAIRSHNTFSASVDRILSAQNSHLEMLHVYCIRAFDEIEEQETKNCSDYITRNFDCLAMIRKRLSAITAKS